MPRRVLAAGEPHDDALQAAPERALPRRHAVHRRRRRLHVPARALRHLELQALPRGREGSEEGRRPHRRHHHRRAGAGAHPAAHRSAHHEQGVVHEAQRAEAPGLQEQGRDLRLAQRQRHRPLHPAEPRGRREDGRGAQLQLVGQARGQRGRDRLPADQAGFHAPRGPPHRRDRLRARSAAAGHRPAQAGSEDQGGRGQREPHHLPRHGPVARRAPLLEREGQEPLQGQARARGLPAGDRRERHQDAGDARARRSRRRSCTRPRSTAIRRTSTT